MERRIKLIEEGKAVLGIELGSTRIKAVLIDDEQEPVATGSYEWENQLIDGIWTYSLEDIWKGLSASYCELKADVAAKYGVRLTGFGAIGISAMMHGYMAFDKAGNLLVPFRTWRNTITSEAAAELTELFQFNIPDRWSVAHLYKAILEKEAHVSDIDYVSTLSGYIHWKLTGEKALGIGDASGMFPIDSNCCDYNKEMVEQFNQHIKGYGFSWKLEDIFPKVLTAGEAAGTLTQEGARLLDPSGELKAGIPMCPPEGDAGTGMVATNSVKCRTGNVSAGTSVFAMVVLEKGLSRLYREIDMVTTPAGDAVAMSHANNCTTDLNVWVSLFREFCEAMGMPADMGHLYSVLYNKALEGDKDCGGLLSYGYYSGEGITGLNEGRPLFVRCPDSTFNLSNFMRSHLYTALGALKIGMDILMKQEKVKLDVLMGHGGLFKTKNVGQKIMASGMNVPVKVMETAGEGGAWGIALLADYMLHAAEGEPLGDYLQNHVFAKMEGSVIEPEPEETAGFEKFMERYKTGLAIEKAAVETLIMDSDAKM